MAYCSVYEEAPLGDIRISYFVSVSAWAVLDNGLLVPPDAGIPEIQATSSLPERDAALRELNRDASEFLNSIDLANAVIRQRNARIAFALRQLTGVDAGPRPVSWWKWWWEDYNEMYSVPTAGERKPARDYDTFGEYVFVAPCSCFAPATKVWTMTGRRAIESIKVGDCVLAQEVESGSLSYKPVLGVTIRRAPPTMTMRAGADTLTTTPGHPFWVAGAVGV